MNKLDVFRSKAKGLPDIMQFAALVDSGIIRCKNGAVMAGFFFRGEDLDSVTINSLNTKSEKVNRAVMQMGSGWVSWIEACRVTAPGYSAADKTHFPDEITKLIDAERRANFMKSDKHFETEYALIVQYMPPIRRQKKGGKIKPLGEMVFEGTGVEEIAPDDKIVTFFKKAISELRDRLSEVVTIQPMVSYQVTDEFGDVHHRDEFVNFLRYCVTGETCQLNIPPIPMYMDAYFFKDDFVPGALPKLGSKFISVVAIEGFPSSSHHGILRTLDKLPLTYRWSTRFIYLDAIEAEAALNRYRKKWQQKIRGWWSQVFKTNSGVINTDAVNMTQQAEAAINQVSSGETAYGYYSTNIVLMHEDRAWLENLANYVRKEIERIGFGARVETINAVEAWLGSIPGHAAANVRRPLVSTRNLADLIPLSSVWSGLEHNPCPFYAPESPALLYGVTAGSTPFRLNLHVGDLGHTLVLGPPGSGKSTLLSLIAAQFRKYANSVGNATIAAFDKGGSMLPLAYTAGRHYEPGGDESPSFCPLQYLDTQSDIAWADEWIATCYELQSGKPASPQQKNAIHRAMLLLSEQEGRSLTDFIADLQDEEVREALAYYTISGSMGHLLDASEDGLTVDGFSVFETDSLFKMAPAASLPVLLYLFRRFEKSLLGQPALLVLDEAWVMLSHPVFREKIREWLKELRKKNCVVILATQSLSDATRSGILDVLLEACPTKIYLANSEADKAGTEAIPGPRDFYTMFGLNDREITTIKNARAKRDYYYRSELGSRLFQLGVGPVALSFVGVSNPDSLKRIKTLKKDFGQKWPYVWMKERKVSYEEYA
ncbi:transporter [Xanthomonas perforans]|uniref:VirB4 family type IV secretion/conjugal transfer ATPase n=1 Tax=Xanthomonas perforans TaxID=442694 RepID=UPI002358F339|nr:transporter [Xanthomonas perforans]MDC9654350.1 transporter [Xanthomonas perforans]MEB2158970.1 transporter [Xanthomonas campestris pv. campestris]